MQDLVALGIGGHAAVDEVATSHVNTGVESPYCSLVLSEVNHDGNSFRRGARSVWCTTPTARSTPTGAALEPPFQAATLADVDRACELASSAFEAFRRTDIQERARFLEGIADNIAGIGDELIVRAMKETGLPRPRLEGERARTIGQLRLFAAVL